MRNNLPESLIVLDTQDFHALRLERQRLVQKGEDFNSEAVRNPTFTEPDALEDTLARELAAIHRSDITLLCSDMEKAMLVRKFGVSKHKVSFTDANLPTSALHCTLLLQKRGRNPQSLQQTVPIPQKHGDDR